MRSDSLGWIVWGLLAAYTVVLWITKLNHANWGARFLAGRCALMFTLALLLSIEPTFPKMHLLWAAPLIYAASMSISGKIIESHIETAPRRAQKESERTGEPFEAILEREFARWGYAPDEGEPPSPV